MDLEALPPDPHAPEFGLPPFPPLADPSEGSRRWNPARVLRLALVPATIAALVAIAYVVGTGHPAAGVRLANASSPPTTTLGTIAHRGHLRGITAGRVASVHGSTFTLTTFWGKAVSVRISGTTTLSEELTKRGAVGDAVPGSRVIVRGTPGPGSSVSAEQILIAPVGERAPSSEPLRRALTGGLLRRGPSRLGVLAGFAAGTVTSNDGHTIVLSRIDGTQVTVTASSSTVVAERATARPRDVTTNDVVAVIGTRDATGVLSATHVEILPTGSPLFGGHFQGRLRLHGAPDSRRPPTAGQPTATAATAATADTAAAATDPSLGEAGPPFT